MLLTFKLKSYFDPVIRGRGEAYFKSHRVTAIMESEEGNRLTAIVRGTDPYSVEMRWVGNEKASSDLMMACSCPFFQTSGPCKHLWAMILEVSSLPFGQKANKLGQVLMEGGS